MSEWIKKFATTKNSPVVLRLSPDDAREALEFAGARADGLRTQREFTEKLAKRIGLEIDWDVQDWQHINELRMRVIEFSGRLRQIRRGEIDGHSYTAQDVEDWNEYMQWMNNQYEFLIGLRRELHKKEKAGG